MAKKNPTGDEEPSLGYSTPRDTPKAITTAIGALMEAFMRGLATVVPMRRKQDGKTAYVLCATMTPEILDNLSKITGAENDDAEVTIVPVALIFDPSSDLVDYEPLDPELKRVANPHFKGRASDGGG